MWPVCRRLLLRLQLLQGETLPAFVVHERIISINYVNCLRKEL